MSDRPDPAQNPLPQDDQNERSPFADMSPEEQEAAQAANEAELQAALASLQEEVAALQAKNAELTDQVMRTQADMQNTRRRAEEEASKARKFAIEAFAESLLPVTDSLEAGLAVQDGTVEQIREGAEATLRQLKSAMERNKVLEIAPAAGDKFDPNLHQAISVVPAPGQEPNTVVGLLQKGFTIAERVLRPALVTVSAPN
ncbi:nucleotide exchange factor GrpE [Variovorax sp.]|uniref:nucleotide exchange factor GrpE n=1 Tax=Variovorax sp. TaxID=1871043 RepID=UPI002D237EA1|nr:nucleotide exchange factor GrpE [Variovorax sp.]HYP84053.1 nucleotide exchange factor GrpE [Variovorax sp.]